MALAGRARDEVAGYSHLGFGCFVFGDPRSADAGSLLGRHRTPRRVWAGAAVKLDFSRQAVSAPFDDKRAA